jgi:adenine-specific DNA methylase
LTPSSSSGKCAGEATNEAYCQPSSDVTLELHFDATFTAILAVKEKQIQQSYRPIIGIHKWFARRPGTVFRNLLLAEFNGAESVTRGFFRAHDMKGVIADPFAGGGTPVYEANRLGFSVVASDVNSMAYWIVRQGLAELDLGEFAAESGRVIADVDQQIGRFYQTSCAECGGSAPVKYFLWVKTQSCPTCHSKNDLFPGYLLADDTRHPRNVIACCHCGALNELSQIPRADSPATCKECYNSIHVEGPARRNRVDCSKCGTSFSYPPAGANRPPKHRLWAIEYHCFACKGAHEGRFFKKPDEEDLRNFDVAANRLTDLRGQLPIPADAIPDGDETKRLHRWGYRFFAEMFNDRQLLGLGLLLERLRLVSDKEVRHALLTVFSDFLRYQNMLCRYDTYALKCQDIFSVHGFPVGLVQCENNILGIPRVGSGSFVHFVAKYIRAKEYCARPFETRQDGIRKEIVPIVGERIGATLVDRFPNGANREALLVAGPATSVTLPASSLDGVFTDPPYFDAVQYAELMDFCYAWLRLGLSPEVDAFKRLSTRHDAELTGNVTAGKGLEHFTEGLSAIFRQYSAALKPGAPFVFTYHHNDPSAYVPIVVAILDAGLDCMTTFAVPAEMGASLHIAGTKSSILDTVFVCRRDASVRYESVSAGLTRDLAALAAAGQPASDGDIRCLTCGHIARAAINLLRPSWTPGVPLAHRFASAALCVDTITEQGKEELDFAEAQRDTGLSKAALGVAIG